MRLTPYLNFNGDCEAAFQFYEKCLAGKIVSLFTHGETPAAEHVPANWHGKIMHICLEVGEAVLMGSDSPPGMYEAPQGLYVSIHIESPGEAERIFTDLSEGGTVQMPIQETFWAARFGMVIDRFGTPWMINCEKAA